MSVTGDEACCIVCIGVDDVVALTVSVTSGTPKVPHDTSADEVSTWLIDKSVTPHSIMFRLSMYTMRPLLVCIARSSLKASLLLPAGTVSELS